MAKETISIFIGNYGSYTAGHLIDRPAKLPMPEGELDALLADMQREAEALTGSPCEEFYISDYDGIPLAGCEDLFGEHNDVHELNVMAAQLACMDDSQIEAAAAYISNQGSSVTMDEAMNVLLQADDIGYYDYGWGEYKGTDPFYAAIHDSASPEKKFGYMHLEENPGLREFLESDPAIDAAFDVEEYGRQIEMASDVVLYDDAYLDKGATDVDLNYYEHWEILQEVARAITEDPELAEIAESFEEGIERRQLAALRRDLISEGKGLYKPSENIVVANIHPGAPDGHGAVIGIYQGLMASPEHVSALTGAGMDVAEYCRANHLLTPISEERWAELSPAMAAESGQGWYYSEPVVAGHAAQRQIERRQLAGTESAPGARAVPQAKAPERAGMSVGDDVELTGRSARSQAKTAGRSAPEATIGGRSAAELAQAGPRK